MSTKAGTIGLSAGRPTGFVIWTAIVSTVAAAALIMSAVALTRAGDATGTRDAASLGSPAYASWDAGKLEAMRGRVLAESVATSGYALWDEGKLEAMGGRVLAAAASHGYSLWDAGKLEAMAGRVLAERPANRDYVFWDEAKLEAMAGRVQAEG